MERTISLSYIWENYNVDKEYKMAEKVFSPYIEVLNGFEKVVEVNWRIRFINLFNKLYQYQGKEDYEKEIDIIFHILAIIDDYSGIIAAELENYILEDEVTHGCFGKKARTLYIQVNNQKPEDCFCILKYLQLAIKSKQQNNLFFVALAELFSVSRIHTTNVNHVVVFIAEEKSDFNEKKLELLKELLLDFWVDIEVVWRESYGVVGDDETMKINHITVY